VLENLVARNGAYVDRWEHITRGLPVRCLYAPPHRFGEIGELRRGIIVNHDTVAYQERIRLIHDTGLLQWLDEVSARQGGLRVLEIGGGYGALAYWFKSAFRKCSYIDHRLAGMPAVFGALPWVVVARSASDRRATR
jgi:hypothetical protein